MSAVGAVLLAALVYGGLMFWEWQIESRAKEVDKQIAQVETSINQFQALKDEIAKTETQIKDVQQLLSRHIYWTKFFALLQKYSIDTISYERFTAGTNGSMSLDAHGTDYQTAARQLKLLQMPETQEFVKDASITSVSQDDKGGVSFTVNLTLNNNLFYYATSTANK
jgi:Tfp pilus assembly protein PilN